MREYIKLFWDNAPDKEPAVILYEVDIKDERLALRSIDIFKDGHTCNINNLYDTVIEITPIPTIAAINNKTWGDEFHACLIDEEEFEAIWQSGIYKGQLNFMQDNSL